MLRVCDLVEVQNHSRKDAKIAKELPARENVIVFVQFFAIFASLRESFLSLANSVI